VINAIRAMLWKEWTQLQSELFARDNLRGGILTTLFFVGAFGIFEPWQIGPGWIGSPIMLFSFVVLLPLAMVGTMIPDSFAGERERRTLEPLLATPLPDQAILLGKIGSAVGYSWGLTLVSMLLGLLTENLLYARSGLLLYPADLAIGTVGFGLLIALFTASAGVLASLHAPTVRQAQQSLGVVITLPLIVPAFFIGPFAPLEWKLALGHALTAMGTTQIVLAVAIILLILDIALVLVALARFRRTELLLD